MKITDTWGCALFAALVSLGSALAVLYSDVQILKVAKADAADVSSFKLEFSQQMTRNTMAIENLNTTIQELSRRFNEQ